MLLEQHVFYLNSQTKYWYQDQVNTAEKMKFSIKNILSKCDNIDSSLVQCNKKTKTKKELTAAELEPTNHKVCKRLINHYAKLAKTIERCCEYISEWQIDCVFSSCNMRV